MWKIKFLVGQGNYVPRERKGVDRSVFILKDVINVYPDTLAWVMISLIHLMNQ
jgi:hypothetical protein